MSDNTVKLKIKVEDDNSFKTVETNADELRKAIEQVKSEADKINSSLLNANQIAGAIDEVSSMFRGLQSVMRDLTDSYAVQAAAESRLEQMMRNTMSATDEEIQSIKNLAAEQQKIGVIGDEVILSGAQELATYMQKKDSLEALIPVMNDMIAQQYGFNASSESAVSVAQMMGKVFAGEVGALKRLGYTFDEAQEEILKFGTEEEKVATLTEVVGQIVDGTNAKLAATPYGQIKQFGNDLGDIKEKLGEMVAPAMNAVEKISGVVIALAGVFKGTVYIKQASAALKGMSASASLAALKVKVLELNSKLTAAAQRMLGVSATSATGATTGLRIAVAALYTTLTMGLALAIQGIITLFTKLVGRTGDAAGGMDELREANEAYKNAVSSTKAEIDGEIAKLKQIIDKGNDTTDTIQRLNEKYSEAFGYYQTAADWYNVLTNKSLDYCRQLGYEAKAKELSAKIGAKIVERDAAQKTLDSTQRYTIRTTYHAHTGTGTSYQVETREYKKAAAEVASLNNEIATMEAEMKEAFDQAADAANALKAGTDNSAKSVEWQTMSYAELGEAINDQKKKLATYSDASGAEAQQEKSLLAAMSERYHTLGVELGLTADKVKEIKNELARTRVELTPGLTPKEFNGKVAPTNLEFVPTFIDWITNQQIQTVAAEVAKISPGSALTTSWNGLKGIGNSIRDINSALTESEDAWIKITSLVDGFISLFQSFSSIVEIIKNLTGVTQTMQAVDNATTQQKLSNDAQKVTSNSAVATSNMEVAATGAAASVASIPWVGPVLAVAAVASVAASLMSLPKFANGGIVYGPTLGLMGEYSGASNNPEVIAPLNKLRSLLGVGGGAPSEVKFRIEGRELVGVLNKQNNIYNRER